MDTDEPKEPQLVRGEDVPDHPVDPFESPPEVVVSDISTQEQFQEEDVAHFNYMLRRSQDLWERQLDAEDFCKLANTTMKLLEMRRKMAMLRTEVPKDDGRPGFGKGAYFGAFSDRN